MNAVISIDQIAIECNIGVTQSERAQKQTILVSVELVVDAQKAMETDAIAEGVDYKKVYETTINITQNAEYHLLESLAKKLLDTYLSFPKVKKAAVTITKPNRLPQAKGVSVTLRGENNE